MSFSSIELFRIDGLCKQYLFYSTISTCLNSWAGVLFEDFIRPNFKKPISEVRASFYMKVIVAVVGTITMLLALTVDKLGGVVQVHRSFQESQILSMCLSLILKFAVS